MPYSSSWPRDIHDGENQTHLLSSIPQRILCWQMSRSSTSRFECLSCSSCIITTACAIILTPNESPWQKLYHHGDPSSFLLMTGLTREALVLLIQVLFPDRDMVPKCRGRPSSLSYEEGQLGLLLFYLGSTMNAKHLCLLFGITPSVFSWILISITELVVVKLRWDPLARVKFPSEEEMQKFACMINLREPQVNDIIGFMDRVSLCSECMDEWFTQNAFYCGYNCNTLVNNVFAYGPDGKVFFCAVNYPGR